MTRPVEEIMKYLTQYGNFDSVPNINVKRIIIGPLNTFLVYLINGEIISTRKLVL